MKSIQLFLITLLLATITLFNFVAAINGYRASMLQTEKLFDEQLANIAYLLSNTENENPRITTEETSNIAYQIWNANHQLIQRSENAPALPISLLKNGYDHSNFSGYRWRTFSFFNTSLKQQVIVAERVDLRYLLAESVILKSIIPNVAGLPIIAIIIWYVVKRGLSPLNDFANKLTRKKTNDLTPIEIDKTPKELYRVIQSTNNLLTRLAESFDREKRFAADAAHELRTPISVLKVHLHNLEQELPNKTVSLLSLKECVATMNHLVEQIIALYRTAPDQYFVQLAPVNLTSLSKKIIVDQYQKFSSKNQQIEFIGNDVTIIGDEFSLEILLKNLLDNANKYTPEEGIIRITVKQTLQEVLLRVEDSGPGVPKEAHERIFERFYRLGGDQHQSLVSGCGLGLAIVKHIANLHQARIHLQNSCFASGLAVNIIFPNLTKNNS